MAKIIVTGLLMMAMVGGGALFFEDIAELDIASTFMRLVENVNHGTVVARTYEVRGESVFINTWLVDTRNQQVVSTGSFKVAMNHDFEEMLQGTFPF